MDLSIHTEYDSMVTVVRLRVLHREIDYFESLIYASTLHTEWPFGMPKSWPEQGSIAAKLRWLATLADWLEERRRQAIVAAAEKTKADQAASIANYDQDVAMTYNPWYGGRLIYSRQPGRSIRIDPQMVIDDLITNSRGKPRDILNTFNSFNDLAAGTGVQIVVHPHLDASEA